jgi:predicted phosphodiesterase
MYHVAAVYDGQTMQLYVNGELDGESKSQSGDILYPEAAPVVVAAYRDQNEFFPLKGCVREVSLYDLAAKDAWVAGEFAHASKVAQLRPIGTSVGNLSFVIKPYLQYGTQTEMTVMWETSKKSRGKVRFGETADCDQELSTTESAAIHTVTMKDLKPETQYFYQTVTESDSGDLLESEVYTFVTAVHESTPYAFAVIGDTQGNPPVASKLASYAWAQRPSFAIHAGDLVDTGTRDTDWTEQFFPSMHELMCRVPLYPVLGNHEQNADNYFNYMSLPAPEYYYQFRFGNAQFFMIDSNRNVDPDSEQYQWLDTELAKSDATWKFVCHHHPPFSSDENDYGDLWKTNQSSRGDLRVRQLSTLYEKHSVDIVWNGHIHSYERTWPVKEMASVENGGTRYVITGGGGGGLETPGPVRPFFQNNVRRGHHYVMVYVNGSTLEFKAFDLDDRLFDTLVIKKPQ